MNASSLLLQTTACLALAGALTAPLNVFGQSENFDSGTLSAEWKTANFNPGLVNTSFVDTAMGKSFRIRANSVPEQAPAAAFFYRDDVYTDFYVAIDIVDWPGTDKDQAIVLFGRATLSPNPLATRGVICNYDPSQEGENATDRRQGQFQINLVTDNPPFGTKTLAAAEITLQPGRPYRMVLMGVGSLYTAKIYDHQDLTKPLVEIHADDVIQGNTGGGPAFPEPFTSGKCGILSFTRVGAPYTGASTDVTIDNYYAGPSDPNTAAAPALPHPVAGTPIVSARVPAERFKNFHDPALGISFTAKTFSADQINAAATKVLLNGVDVSSQLTLSPNGATITGALPGSALAANTVYSASIEVSDLAGAKKSLNTFWFDTFSDSYLRNAAAKKIEAEDFNHDGGLFLPEPFPVSGLDKDGNGVNAEGQGYYGYAAVEGVDFHDARGGGAESPWFAEYRDLTPVGLSAGMFPEIIDLDRPETPPLRMSDNVRSQYASLNLPEYVVHRTEPGEWLNYTRTFVPGQYTAYLRVASFGGTAVELHRVTSDAGQPEQTTTKLGTFNIPNQLTRYNYRYIPLTTDAGAPAPVTLDGLQTLRLQMAGTVGQDRQKIALNYLLLIPEPVTGSAATIFDNFADGNDSANPAWDRFDPIGGLTAPPAGFTFPNGAYHIVSPTPLAEDAGPARAGTFLRGATYSDFYVSVDIIDFDDTIRQAFGVAARIVTPALGTTGGYLFSWEPGDGVLPGTGGDLDISRVENESPVAQIETAPSQLHLTKGKSYRFVFMGRGADFEGQVYELPNTATPIIRLPAHDPTEKFMSGKVGLIVADQGSGPFNAGDATFDNFLATTVEPRIAIAKAGNSVTLTFPNTGFRLESSGALGGAWTAITTGITVGGVLNTYTTVADATEKYFRLAYP